MKSLIALSFLIIFGPELARAINGPEPVKAKAVRSAR
jgi:hypothetical protein